LCQETAAAGTMGSAGGHNITQHSTNVTAVRAPHAAECHFKEKLLPFPFKFISSHTPNAQLCGSVPELSSLLLSQIYCSIKRNYLWGSVETAKNTFQGMSEKLQQQKLDM
jgi:hypothetical protein